MLAQLPTFAVGNGGVVRSQAGAQEPELTRRVRNRTHHGGVVRGATGLRLLAFVFADEAGLKARFAAHGVPEPEFTMWRDGRRSALVPDPDGQDVELVIVPHGTPEELARIEIGPTVADLERSRAYYGEFVGLEELPPIDDERFGVCKYSYRHGATTISLRSFGGDLPADTGSGGIQ